MKIFLKDTQLYMPTVVAVKADSIKFDLLWANAHHKIVICKKKKIKKTH